MTDTAQAQVVNDFARAPDVAPAASCAAVAPVVNHLAPVFVVTSAAPAAAVEHTSRTPLRIAGLEPLDPGDQQRLGPSQVTQARSHHGLSKAQRNELADISTT